MRGFINSGYGEFKKFVEKTVDAELAGKIRIAETYNHHLASHISKIKSKCISDIQLAGQLINISIKSNMNNSLSYFRLQRQSHCAD